MDTPSTSRGDLADFQRLPWQLRRQILSHLSATEYLNMAKAHPFLEKAVLDVPKRWTSVDRDNMLRLEKVTPGGRGQLRNRDYVAGSLHPKQQENRIRNNCNPNYEMLYVEERKKTKETETQLLLKNSTVVRLDGAMKKFVVWNMRAEHLHYPIYQRLKELQFLVDKLGATGVTLRQKRAHVEESSMDFFLANPKIHTANFPLCGHGELHKISSLKQPRLRITIADHSDGIHDVLFSVADEMIRQWENNERTIDAVMLQLETSEQFGDDEFENILNFELNDMAKRLAYARLGQFADKNLDPRFKLIRREEGQGLLIMTGGLTLMMVACDYQSRRTRGLGLGDGLEEAFNALEARMHELRVIEWRIYQVQRFGKPEKPRPEKPVVDQDMFSIFGDVEAADPEDEPSPKSDWDPPEHEYEPGEPEEHLVKERARIEGMLKDFLEKFKGIPEREMAIDLLYRAGIRQINSRLLNHISGEGFELGKWPAQPTQSHHHMWEARLAYEFLDIYGKTGVVPSFYC